MIVSALININLHLYICCGINTGGEGPHQTLFQGQGLRMKISMERWTRSYYCQNFLSLEILPQKLFNRKERPNFLNIDLTFRASQAENAVRFKDYYHKNWRSCAVRWVLAYRNNLPTKGCNDTQAIESTFSAIKRFSKCEFGMHT